MSHGEEKRFPEGMEPLGERSFHFLCHRDIACFTLCCRNVDLDLYPYDIIRLKQCLGIDSESFMRSYTETAQGANPYFPTVKLKLVPSGGEKICPFLDEDGCRVYDNRPTACRTYPLERAVDRSFTRGKTDEFYFLITHPYCCGHHEKEQIYSVRQWLRNQRLHEYNTINDLWAEVDTLFAGNPWKGEGSCGPKQQLAFFVCYNIDGFRAMVEQEELLEQFVLDRSEKQRIGKSDSELLKFGFSWLKAIFGGATSLVRRSL